MALPKIRTHDWADTWGDFTSAWERYDPERDPVTQMRTVLGEARQRPAPREVAEYDSARLNDIAGLCRELQRRAGNGDPFHASMHLIAEAMGCDPKQVQRVLNMMRADGYLELIEKGSRGSGKASTYRWRGAP